MPGVRPSPRKERDVSNSSRISVLRSVFFFSALVSASFRPRKCSVPLGLLPPLTYVSSARRTGDERGACPSSGAQGQREGKGPDGRCNASSGVAGTGARPVCVSLIRAPIMPLLSVEKGPSILFRPFKSPLKGHQPGKITLLPSLSTGHRLCLRQTRSYARISSFLLAVPPTPMPIFLPRSLQSPALSGVTPFPVIPPLPPAARTCVFVPLYTYAILPP